MERVGSGSGRLVFVSVALALLIAAGTVMVIRIEDRMTKGQLKVSGTWSDGVDSPPGSTYFLLDVNVADAGPSTWHLDPSLFSLASNGSHSFTFAANYSALALLGKEDLLPGHSISGEVAFLLPWGQTPSTLSYGDSAISVQPADVPPVSGEASRFDPSVHFLLEGASTQNGAITADGITTWAAISNNTSALTFFGGEHGYRSNSFVFFTGQNIEVSFAFYYYRVPGAPNSLTIDSVSSDDGYAVSNVLAWKTSFLGTEQPSALPTTLTGYGSNVEVTLLATVPSGPQAGVLHFTVQFSG